MSRSRVPDLLRTAGPLLAGLLAAAGLVAWWTTAPGTEAAPLLGAAIPEEPGATGPAGTTLAVRVPDTLASSEPEAHHEARLRAIQSGRDPGRALFVLCADPAGAPRAWTEVFAIPAAEGALIEQGADRWALRSAGARLAWTDVEGIASMLDLEPGDYLLGVVPLAGGRHPRPTPGNDLRATVHDDRDAVGFLDLVDPAFVRGRVLAAGAGGWITTRDDAIVRARCVGGEDPWCRAEARTVGDRYEVAVRPGRVRLEVACAERGSPLDGLATPEARYVDLAPGETVREDWVFGASSAWIEGSVVDQFGEPWTGLELRIVASDVRQVPHPPVELATAFTDGEGRYRMGPVPEGPYELRYGPSDPSEAEAFGIGEPTARCRLAGDVGGRVDCGERVLYRRVPAKVRARIELGDTTTAMPRFVDTTIESQRADRVRNRTRMTRVVRADGTFGLWASAHTAGRVRFEIHGDAGIRTHVVPFEARTPSTSEEEELLLDVVLAYP